jgi:hypothetical protein
MFISVCAVSRAVFSFHPWTTLRILGILRPTLSRVWTDRISRKIYKNDEDSLVTHDGHLGNVFDIIWRQVLVVINHTKHVAISLAGCIHTASIHYVVARHSINMKLTQNVIFRWISEDVGSCAPKKLIVTNGWTLTYGYCIFYHPILKEYSWSCNFQPRSPPPTD